MASMDSPNSLSSAIDEYLRHRRSLGKKPNTLKQDRRALRAFLSVTGNILLKSVTDSHVTRFFEHAAKTRQPISLAIDTQVLNGFFKWARDSRRIPARNNPMIGRRHYRAPKKVRRLLPATKFDELLDAAPHPRDRACLAVAIYLLLRASEIKTIRIRDVDLDSGIVMVQVHKSDKEEILPITTELDKELRQWFTYYSATCGPLQPDWYLVPSKVGARFKQDWKTKRFTNERITDDLLRPTQPIGDPAKVAQRALRAIGFLTEDKPNGKPVTNREGIHTLRRSGGRALFDRLQSMEPFIDENGVEVRPPSYPIRTVQAMLNHSSQARTEIYIGLEPDRQELIKLLKGRPMYAINRENVVDLRPRRESAWQSS